MSTDFSRSYQPPGVYIEEEQTAVVSTTGIPPTLVCIVGEASGHQTSTEQIPFGEDVVTLTKQGIDTASITVVVSGTNEVVGSADLVITKVSQNPTVTQDYFVTLGAGAGNDLPQGTPVFVTYEYTTADYFEPKRVTNFDDVQALYGEALNLTEGAAHTSGYQHILSPLSLGAKVALENGATELVLCATAAPTGSTDSARSSSRRTNLKAAYEKTATLASVNVLVVLSTGIATADASGVLTDISGHVDRAETEDYARFAVVGFDAAVTTAPDELISASGIKNKRMMLAFAGPGGMNMYSGSTNSTFSVSHAYLAAGYAGKMASLPVQQSLTKQPIFSFSGVVGAPLTNSLKNQYAQGGVAVAEISRLNRLVVRHGRTTDSTNINTREAAVVRARDALVTLVSNGFADANLIGQPVDEDLVFAIKSMMQGYLETSVQTETIIAYSGLAVRQRPDDPSVVEIKFAYRPAYPLNYIAISFSIDTSIGTIVDTTDAAAA